MLVDFIKTYVSLIFIFIKLKVNKSLLNIFWAVRIVTWSSACLFAPTFIRILFTSATSFVVLKMESPREGEDSENSTVLGTFNHAQVVLPDNDNSYNISSENSKPGDQEFMDTSNTNVMDDKQPRSNRNTNNWSTLNNSTYFNPLTAKYNINNIYVFIEKLNNENIGRFHPLKVGHILHKKLSIKNITDIKSVGINRVRVQLKTIKDANDLISNSLLASENLKAYIPRHLLVKKGLIRGVDTFFDNDYLMQNIESPSKVLDVKRMTKKVEKDGKSIFVNRQSVILTFEGNVLPPEIRINSVIFSVENFYGKVTQCFKCFKYGHISKQCRSTNTVCFNCGKTKSNDHACTENDIICINCKSSQHKSYSKNCPEYEKQRKIKQCMIDNNLTFHEAKKYCENSFAGCTTSNRFNLLANHDVDFPILPNRACSTFKPHSSTQPIGRNELNYRHPPSTCPSMGSTSVAHPNIKKRKLPSSPPTPSHQPMFPFRFSAPTPLPPNCNYSRSNTIIESKLSESVTSFFFNFLDNIKTIDDIKGCNHDDIRKEINNLLVTILNNAQILSTK